MALSGVKYFSAVSTNKRFLVHQHAEEARINAMQRRMLGRVWKEKEQLLNEFIKINVKTANGSAADSRHIELKQMAVDPKLVLPMDLKSVSLKHQAVIAPVITIDGRGATLYPKKGAKHGRHVALTSKVYERMHKASNISTTLDHIATGNRETGSIASRASATHRQTRVRPARSGVSAVDTTDDISQCTEGKGVTRKKKVVLISSSKGSNRVRTGVNTNHKKRGSEDSNFTRAKSAP